MSHIEQYMTKWWQKMHFFIFYIEVSGKTTCHMKTTVAVVTSQPHSSQHDIALLVSWIFFFPFDLDTHYMTTRQLDALQRLFLVDFKYHLFPSRLCNEKKPCPLPVLWTAWAPWSHCSAECGGGVHFRTRVCDNGSSCPGCSMVT